MNMLKNMMVLVIAFVFSAAPAQGAWSLVDDFEGDTPGALHGQTADNGQVWAVSSTSQNSIVVGGQDSSQVLEYLSDTPQTGRADLPLGAVAITEGNSGTLYCRVKLNNVIVGAVNSYIVGGYDGTGTGNDSKTVAVAMKNNNDGTTGTAFASSSATGTSIAIQLGQWYDLWFYVDLTAADVANYYFEAYIAGPGLEGQVPLTLTGGAVQQPLRAYTAGSGIAYFSTFKSNSTNPSHGGYIDDAFIDLSGKNLTSVPEPASLILLGLGSLMLRRKK